jgi:DNA-binding beta-propeller fold protein YncE
MLMARLVFLVLLIPVPGHAFELRGLSTPESFIVDPATGIYYISNVNGEPKAKDNNGFIVKADPSGKPIDLEFIKGGKNQVELNAPKGLAISGNDLFVSDIDVVHRFDKSTGQLLGTIDLKLIGAVFLNDVVADPNGNIFVSDTFGNFIFRIDTKRNYQVSILSKGPLLENPNGLAYDPVFKRLVVVTWGTGRILLVDMNGKLSMLGIKPFKNLDGIDFDRKGNIIVSDFTDGKIYRIKNLSTVELIKENLLTPADISFDYKNNQILVPSFDGNLVFTQPLD